MSHRTPTKLRQRLGVTPVRLILGALLLAIPGCAIPALIGGMARSAELTGSTTIDAEYFGLEGKSYAVIVVADRIIQAEFPAVTNRLTARIDGLLRQNAGASGHVEPARLLRYLYDKPGWNAIPRGQLAEELQVECLVVLDLLEYRVTGIGNQYTWDGVAAATLEVYETEASFPDDPVFDRTLRVVYPDYDGVLREELSEAAVNTVLTNRLSDRAAWLFYEHDEPNQIRY